MLLMRTVVTIHAAKKNKKIPYSKAKEAEDHMRVLSAKFATQNVVPLTDSNYTRFVSFIPREYSAVVMFTALSSNHQCTICKSLLPVFNDVAAFYYAQYSFNASSPKERLAFFIVDADTAGGMRPCASALRFTFTFLTDGSVI